MKEKVLISYLKGITRTPSDLLNTDGELAECVNLEVRNEELSPVEMPVKMGVFMDEGERLMLVHHIKSSGKNYFSLTGGTLRAFSIEGNSKVYYSLVVECGDVKSMQAVGNTVVVYTKDTPHYIIFTDGMYKYLGSSLPLLSLSFGLSGTMVISDSFDVDVPKLEIEGDESPGDPDLTTEENREKVKSQIIPRVNKFIADESEEKGLFIYPFLVRYAYRLFDGNYVMQSAPALMLPSTTMAPICGYKARTDKRPPFETFIAAVTSKLTVQKDTREQLGDWADIISSISIFVSSPIRTYDQEGEIESFGKHTTGPSFFTEFYGSLYGSSRNHNIRSYMMDFSPSNPGDHVLWDLPQKDMGEVMTEISGCSLFYKYASYSPEYIDSHSIWTIEPDEVGVNPVLGIEHNEQLPDDYMTHDTLIPESSFVYNSRLNISNVKRILFKGFPAASLGFSALNGDNPGFYYVYTYIKTLNGSVIVKSATSIFSFHMYGMYLFYPDTDAYRMVIHDTQNNRYADVPLSEHSGLNGAVYFDGFKSILFQSGSPSVSETERREEYLPNKLFTSDVNNPFRFPLAGINTVGSGEIIGIAAVTRPISQGQFGEYPLIAFCSDGNFALKVDSEGFYSGISPIQEDTVLGGEKITPMENSVAIITQKGIMITSGNDMGQVAVQMDGGNTDNSSLEGIETTDSRFEMLVTHSKETEGFLQYLHGSRMAFDYSSNRLFIYHPEKTYFYIYRFDNGTVCKAMFGGGHGVVSSVTDYPDTILQDGNGNLYSVYEKDDVSVSNEHRNGFALTRPMKFGGAMTLKSVKQIHNLFARLSSDSFVKYNLYGSNDNLNYYRVASRFGKPYKYYRIALYSHLLPKESISGSVVTYEERRNHKLR